MTIVCQLWRRGGEERKWEGRRGERRGGEERGGQERGGEWMSVGGTEREKENIALLF